MASRLVDDPPDAVIALNDAMAIGALHRFRTLEPARGPAVTGFDDIAWAQLTDPSTIAVDAEAIGTTAALLFSRLATPDHNALPVREVRIPATVRPRRACGCSEQSPRLPDVAEGGQANSIGPHRADRSREEERDPDAKQST